MPDCTACVERIRRQVYDHRIPRRHCRVCNAPEVPVEVAETIRADFARIRAAESSEAVCSDFARFLRPLPALVEKNPEHWETARKWNGGNLLVLGPKGTGKTALCRYILGRAIEWGRSVVDLPAINIEGQHLYWESRESLVDRAKRCHILLIDDPGNVPHWTGGGLNTLRYLINYRADERLTTFMTANDDKAGLLAKLEAACPGDFGATTLERLRPFTEMVFKGRSIRPEL